MDKVKAKLYTLLRKSEKYTKTDMTYVVKGGFWLTVGQIFTSLSSLILSIVFANFLSKDIFGTYKYILSVVSILSIASLSGIDTAVTQAVARGNEGSFKDGLKSKIKWGYLGSIAGIILAIYYYFQSNFIISFSFLIASIFIPFLNSLNLYGAYLNGKKNFKSYTLYNSIWSIVGPTALTILTVFLTKNIFILIAMYFLSNTAFNAFFYLYTLKQYPPNNKKEESGLLFAKHLSFIDFFNTFFAQLDKILVFHYLGAIELATYTIAVAPTDQLKNIFKNINVMALPRFATRTKENMRANIFNKLLKLGIIVSLSVIFYIIIAPFLFKIIFPKYIVSIFYSQIMAVSVIAATLTAFLDTVFRAHSMKKEIYHFNIYGNTINLILLPILIYYHGLMGAVVARLIGRFLIFLVATQLVKKM
jgi:O-antigen/teichoic acid export membrane protein